MNDAHVAASELESESIARELESRFASAVGAHPWTGNKARRAADTEAQAAFDQRKRIEE